MSTTLNSSSSSEVQDENNNNNNSNFSLSSSSSSTLWQRELSDGAAPCVSRSQQELEELSRTFDRKPICRTLAEVAANIEERPLRPDSPADVAVTERIVRHIVKANPNTEKEMSELIFEARRQVKRHPPNAVLLYAYRQMCERGDLPPFDEKYARLLRCAAVRSRSGVMVVAVFTSPYPTLSDGSTQPFSCRFDCHYCPAEPNQPRSYLLQEPGVARANRNNFHAVSQFWDRCMSYHVTGHPVDKIELLILGGTWSSYPADYQELFVRDLFYAANTFTAVLIDGAAPREPWSLDEEQRFNESSDCRVIGVTIETRPDTIWGKELRRLRRLGVTRVQLGIQHTDDDILRTINRGCTTADAVKAFQLLKDCCFKIDIHLMPDLPTSSPERDLAMFNYVLDSEDLQADQWKIYPCEVTPWTRIKEWFDAGTYRPYGNELRERTLADGATERYNPLFELILAVKRRVHPWIRLNRVIRDIPGEYIQGGNMITNLRQLLATELARRHERCQCIRCRECKQQRVLVADTELVVREYRSSGGRELFLSVEDAPRLTLYGFLRLRLSPRAGAGGVFPELERAALIRELHVYGQVVAVGADNGAEGGGVAQHVGFGSTLLLKAEQLAVANGYTRIAVISGVGTRNYYRKRGYEDSEHFLVKTLDPDAPPAPLAIATAASAAPSRAAAAASGKLRGVSGKQAAKQEVLLRRRFRAKPTPEQIAEERARLGRGKPASAQRAEAEESDAGAMAATLEGVNAPRANAGASVTTTTMTVFATMAVIVILIAWLMLHCMYSE
jgi:ELP3 family radical SAM enzyme/protein acetyltransferase